MRARWPASAALAGLLLAACTSGTTPEPSSSLETSAPTTVPTTAPTSVPAPTGSPEEFTLPDASTGDRSAAATRARLCVRPPAPTPTPAQVEPANDAIAEVEDQVEQVRGLDYVHPVAVDAVTHQELVDGITKSLDHSYPEDLMARRSLAWSTIGVIPDGSSLREAYQAFLSSDVIGYYDPSTGELVFIGTDDPSPYERFTLAHELTHADDDQHFNLDRLNDLEDACDEEGLEAAVGSVEGSAVYFSQEVVQEFFSGTEQAQLMLGGGDGGGRPAEVPPFVYQTEIWPYIDGPDFISEIRSERGLDEVNAAIEAFPDSTEQVMHPEKFPDDKPVELDTPDLGPALGEGWKDLDVMETGEEWLLEMLSLHLDRSVAQLAADGWGGAQYRAWTDGTDAAVVLNTTWDTPEDADGFLQAMRTWAAGRDDAAVGRVAGDDTTVVALFGSNAATLQRLEAALR